MSPRSQRLGGRIFPVPFKRLPKATLLAIALLIGVELFLRTIPVERLLPRPTSGPGVHTDSGQFSVLAMIDARGSTDIALVGSSMMREAVNVPRMRETLRTRFHRKLTVGDYSVRGAKIEEIAAITHELFTSKRPPKLIFIGLSLRDLQVDDGYADRFGGKPEIRNPKSETNPKFEIQDPQPATSPASLSALPNRQSPIPQSSIPFRSSLSTTLARHCRLLYFREPLREVILHPARGLPSAEVNPITGKAGENFRSLIAEGSVSVKDIRKQLAKQSRTNSLAVDEPALEILEQLITRAQAQRKDGTEGAGGTGGAKVILLEMPIPKVMRKALPRAQYADFLARTSALAERKHVRFLQRGDFEKLNFPPKDGYFLDSQHMNSHGNTRFATILATVAANALSPAAPGTQRP